MADPGTMAALSIGSTLASGALSGSGSILGGNAAASASGYQAQVARINADVARINRDQTFTAGAKKAEAAGIADRQVMGKIVTGQAASGLDITSGSPAELRASQQKAASRDIASIYDNTARAAYGYEVEASNKEASARMLDATASGQRQAGVMKGLGTILGTASTVSGRWMDAQRTGVWGGNDSGPWVGSTDEYWKESA